MNPIILVAPYWNLNATDGKVIVNSGFILVAPYWNLNHFHVAIVLENFRDISSSILEFKFEDSLKPENINKHISSSILEFK